MTAYLVTNFTVKDPEKYEQYRQVVGPTLAKYKGNVLIAGTEHELLEGEVPQPIVVVLEFESAEAIHAWYDSPEYQEIVHLRRDASANDAWAIIMDKFEIPA